VAPRFFGRDDRSLDGKGRVILPARFRSSFDASVFITPHYERCLALWTQEEFEKKFAEMSSAQESGTEGRNLARMWSATSAEEKIDAQGRISIPQNLREFARLEPESPVLVTGSIDRIELWNPEAWEARIGPSESFLADPDLPGGPGAPVAPPGPGE
jgi:MraZ protein